MHPLPCFLFYWVIVLNNDKACDILYSYLKELYMNFEPYNPFARLKPNEWVLWLTSVAVVGVSGAFAGSSGVLNTVASVIGVTALIFVAKGDVFGQVITIIFSILYGIVSLKFKYYGEMITYMFMSAPAAFITLIAWLRHPYKDSHEVKVGRLTKGKLAFAVATSAALTVAFYFMLKYLNTTNLEVSTVSVLTSALASILLILRSPYYALAYSLNDIVLIVLWLLATLENIKYLPMILCFVMFLANDLYGFYNWKKMKKRQA